jgi:hypothetical protein
VAVEAREQDREELVRAATLRAPLLRVARLARSNGMGYAVFGALTAMLSLSTSAADLASLGVAAVLLFVGLSGRALAARLRDGDAQAARLLSRNELLLLGAIAAYAVLMLTAIDPLSDEIDQLLASSGTRLDTESLRRATYFTVLAVTVLYQGGLAWRYRRAAPDAERYVAEVPEWAREAAAALPG